MKTSNRWNLLLIAGVFLFLILGCKSAEERERQRQNQAQREQKAEQKKKTAEVVEALETKADEWARLAPPVKLVNDPYVKGKLVVVYRRANDVNEVLENDVIGFGELHAQTPDEAQTVVQTDCFEVRRGSYVTQDEEKKQIPAYISECEAAIIDLTLPAIIYRKKFENTNLQDEISSKSIDWETVKRKNKVVTPQPQREIRDFMLSLPRQ